MVFFSCVRNQNAVLHCVYAWHGNYTCCRNIVRAAHIQAVHVADTCILSCMLFHSAGNCTPDDGRLQSNK